MLKEPHDPFAMKCVLQMKRQMTSVRGINLNGFSKYNSFYQQFFLILSALRVSFIFTMLVIYNWKYLNLKFYFRFFVNSYFIGYLLLLIFEL